MWIADVGPHRMASASMVAYQAFFVLVFLLLPAFSLYQLNAVVLERGVLWHEGDPALGGIALKNAFAWTQGGSGPDVDEHACASEVIRDARDGAYTWLDNRRCDFAKAARLKPFVKDGESLLQNAGAAAKTCTQRLAQQRTPPADVKPQPCEGARDISEESEGSERNCRGLQWLPVASPLLLILSTALGWTMFLWLIVEAGSRKVIKWTAASRSKVA